MWFSLVELFSNLFAYVGYIRSKSFEKPLSRLEEAKCLEALKNHDQEAREKLIRHNLRLVAHIVKKYDMKKLASDDLISVGSIGLMKAIDSFDASKGHRFTTYASVCIENEILMYLRRNKRHLQNVSLDDLLISGKDGNMISMIDTIPCVNQVDVVKEMALNENIERLKRYLKVLDERELEIISKRFGLFEHKEQKQREIAQELGISRSYVSRIEKRAFLKLYREFMKEDKLYGNKVMCSVIDSPKSATKRFK